ncbi:hypothetical protein DPEC_G00005690 [Dallia pectoralis]|uniref:Uncharacterized protein n=1 Tax=Dallia pectoralis TaxID=75939 RepID=A0ACC2HKA0_DALPE|nr:hypothetical protein DPEC_G00005690 [Dallia pectoralis]
MGTLASAGQMGQHSPGWMMGLAQIVISSQMISSHSTVPPSHTQTRHGSGFHTSFSLYPRPSWMQPPSSSVVTEEVREGAEVGWVEKDSRGKSAGGGS